MKLKMIPALIVLATGCARTDFYFPSNGKDVVVDERGRVSRHHNRAVVLNGSDSLGGTKVRITSNSIEFSSQGGIDNSTSTKEGYRTVRHGVTTAATAAVIGIGISEAASAYSANQAQVSASNVAASKAAADTAAAKGAAATTIHKINAVSGLKAAEAAKALPAAGSTINAVTPATVIPVP